MNDSITWLVFSIHTKKYALASSTIKEIVKETALYALPFVPLFVSGIINRHGEPYTVIDPAILIEKEAQKTNLFLVLKGEEQSCLRITDIHEFIHAPKDVLAPFSANSEISFFEGCLLQEKFEIPVLDVKEFLKKTREELEQS